MSGSESIVPHIYRNTHGAWDIYNGSNTTGHENWEAIQLEQDSTFGWW
jgi:predicted NUDIX family NTP pyrophosphohydrolase